MEPKDWYIIVSTVLGPILAVQAQKWVEMARERKNRKSWIFHTLMATRANRTDALHVQALNMIELGFYGRRIFGRTKSEQNVLDAWKEYLDVLNSPIVPEAQAQWAGKYDDQFVNLLYAISVDMRYSFDRVVLKKGAYNPVAHGNYANELASLRRFGIEVLEGKRAIKMDINSLPNPAPVPQSPPTNVINPPDPRR
jgi:hypothetical protein